MTRADASHPEHDRTGFGIRLTETPRALLVTLAVTVTVGLVLGTLITFVAWNPHAHRDAACGAHRDKPLRVNVAPELSHVLRTALREAAARGDACLPGFEINPVDPSATAMQLENGGPPPDVWIPDSTVWLNQAGPRLQGASDPQRRLATSPLVLAVPASVDHRLHHRGAAEVADLLPTRRSPEGTVRWSLPPPDLSAATVGALIQLRSTATSGPDANAVVSTVIRNSSHDLATATSSAGADQSRAIPMSEQQLYAHNLAHPATPFTGTYPARDQFVFDYPFVTLSDVASRRAGAERLFHLLREEAAQQLLSDAGFRNAAGIATNSVASPDRRVRTTVPEPQTVENARRAYRDVLRPSRLLALIDVSGSMATTVPGTDGASRLDLATQAAVNGMSTYPDDTDVGLWVFATDLTATTDYRELAPIAPLGKGSDGVSGRERLALAMARVAVPKQPHRTGLYDSVLAAVREVRSTWDPTRINSVVVITDGGDSDLHGISLQRLLQTLQRERESRRPVPVYSIAYGAGGDLASLQKISTVTGGKAYGSPDPRQVSGVLRDALGQRVCNPNC